MAAGIRSKYRMKIGAEKEMGAVLSSLIPRFEIIVI